MIPILYDSEETAFLSNGLGRLRECISCEVYETRNGEYECSFKYPVEGAHFNDIMLGRSIAVECGSSEMQPFDIVSSSEPIDGIVEFQAVHISYRLSKCVAYGTDINSPADAFTMFESAVPEMPFAFETDIVSNAYMAAADGVPKSVRSMIGGVEGSLLDTYGGELEWNKFNVKLHESRGEDRDVTIRYGKNLKDYNNDKDASGVYTCCIPYWKGNDTIVRGSLVDSDLTSYNGRNECIPLDLSDKFKDQPTAAQLEAEALSYMQSNDVNSPKQTIKVDFLLLQNSIDYAKYANLLDCKLCDTVNVVFPMYGMESRFKIVKTVYDVLMERYTEMELGTLSTTLSEALKTSLSSSSESSIPKTVTGSPTVQSGWENYTSAPDPLLLKFGSAVNLRWRCKPTASVYLGKDGSNVCRLPEGFRPSEPAFALGQGSGTSIYLITVSSDGYVNLSRLRDMGSTNATFSTATTSMWFPIDITFIID